MIFFFFFSFFFLHPSVFQIQLFFSNEKDTSQFVGEVANIALLRYNESIVS